MKPGIVRTATLSILAVACLHAATHVPQAITAPEMDGGGDVQWGELASQPLSDGRVVCAFEISGGTNTQEVWVLTPSTGIWAHVYTPAEECEVDNVFVFDNDTTAIKLIDASGDESTVMGTVDTGFSTPSVSVPTNEGSTDASLFWGQDGNWFGGGAFTNDTNGVRAIVYDVSATDDGADHTHIKIDGQDYHPGLPSYCDCFDASTGAFIMMFADGISQEGQPVNPTWHYGDADIGADSLKTVPLASWGSFVPEEVWPVCMLSDGRGTITGDAPIGTEGDNESRTQVYDPAANFGAGGTTLIGDLSFPAVNSSGGNPGDPQTFTGCAIDGEITIGGTTYMTASVTYDGGEAIEYNPALIEDDGSGGFTAVDPNMLLFPDCIWHSYTMWDAPQDLGSSTYVASGGGWDHEASESINGVLIARPISTVSLAIDTTSISEGGSAATVTVTRTGTDTSGPLTVYLDGNSGSTANKMADVSYDGADTPTGDNIGLYTTGDEVLAVTIPAGQASTTFTVTAVDDPEAEGEETLAMTLIDVTADTAEGYISLDGNLISLDYTNTFVVGSPNSVTLAITANDGYREVDIDVTENGTSTGQASADAGSTWCEVPCTFGDLAGADIQIEFLMSAPTTNQ